MREETTAKYFINPIPPFTPTMVTISGKSITKCEMHMTYAQSLMQTLTQNHGITQLSDEEPIVEIESSINSQTNKQDQQPDLISHLKCENAMLRDKMDKMEASMTELRKQIAIIAASTIGDRQSLTKARQNNRMEQKTENHTILQHFQEKRSVNIHDHANNSLNSSHIQE